MTGELVPPALAAAIAREEREQLERVEQLVERLENIPADAPREIGFVP